MNFVFKHDEEDIHDALGVTKDEKEAVNESARQLIDDINESSHKHNFTVSRAVEAIQKRFPESDYNQLCLVLAMFLRQIGEQQKELTIRSTLMEGISEKAEEMLADLIQEPIAPSDPNSKDKGPGQR